MWRWPKPSPRSACRTRWRSSMKSWILSTSPCLRSWKEIVEVAQISPERDQEAHRLRSATRARSRNASRRREWISWCLRCMRGDRDGLRYSERKVACPYHTHTLHCERALCSFCGYTKHTPFTSYEPKYNSTVRRNVLIRSGQATPVLLGGNLSRSMMSSSLPALPSVPSDQFYEIVEITCELFEVQPLAKPLLFVTKTTNPRNR